MSITTTKAIVIVELKHAEVREVLMPVVHDEWVLVKIKAIGINPTDWKHIAFGAADVGCRVGCDYAGVVEEVGRKVSSLKKGDRIMGWTHGSNRVNHESGAFAEHAIAKAATARIIPDNLSFEEAASLNVSVMTVGQGFYKSMQMPLPSQPAREAFPVLIYGGSTATGIVGVQLAKLSGLTVITTCSPHNFELMKSLGADAVFDYNSPTCGADIKELTKNRLIYSWDCTGDGAVICGQAMSDSEHGTYGTIMPSDYEGLKSVNPKVYAQDYTKGYDTNGEDYYWLAMTPISPDPEEVRFYRMFLDIVMPLLRKGSLEPPPIVVNKMGEGLEGALKGLKDMQAGNVSGKKMVYTI